ncbi:DUF6765 family protein [Ruminococcus flavefaciens]|uniref:Uncharacterized protein n=1 Tax=Ruminococcus flavefaciens TaxID=1265 RepID=A0A1M7IEW1_RUMFL|nr:DUF6765 family protein [Ruminococcus flavefaciens]SHM39366.1 hypothetical protein SAMN04487860_10482 [Ruminococcus flavefaciens]
MDIAFHYFALKSLALKAGFSDDEAQLIAQYSQMTDDFDYTAWWDCRNVPEYIKNPDYDIINILGYFNPVQTGFLTDGILGKFDYLNLVTPRFQKLSCTPFHFIYNLRNEIGNKEYRVYPAVMNDFSNIWEMLKKARDEYQAALKGETSQYGDNKKYKRKTLMKIGLLLHIFADTTAHQMFSGFNANVNNVKLIKVQNNITGTDETEKYKNSVIYYLEKLSQYCPWITPMIGHMMIAHIPDLTHLTFTMEYKNNEGIISTYTRSNTAEFIMRSEQILQFLLSCRNQEMIPEEEWRDYSDQLSKCFLTDISECSDEKSMVKKLKPIWINCGGTYDYSSEEIKRSFVLETFPLEKEFPQGYEDVPEEIRPVCSTNASDDFYLFNVCAEEVLIDLYGVKPRS